MVALAEFDDISLASYRHRVAGLIAKNFAHWSRIDPIEWAEKVRRMPDGHGGTQPFSFNYFPPQREMYLSMFDPLTSEVVFMIFSRGTKSEAVLTAIGYRVDQQPARILCMWPTVGQAEKWSKDNLMGELIQPTPPLDAVLGEDSGRRKGSNTILHKRYPGGLINIFGSNAPGELRRAKGNFLYAAEIDAIKGQAKNASTMAETADSDEGDVLQIFKKRGSEYPDTIEVYESYPSLKGQSLIDAKYDDSDRRQWFVTCLLCGGEPFVLHRKHLRYDIDQPELARIECPRCHGLLDDAQRYAMMMGGDPKKPRFDLWEPTAPFRGRAGFQANAMLWPHPVNRDKYPGGYLQMLAQQEIDVQRAENPERARRVMVNTVDAEPYEAEHIAKVEHTSLYVRREAYDARELLPDEVLLVVAGCDLQADRVEIKFKGFGLLKTDDSDTKNLSGRVESTRHASEELTPKGQRSATSQQQVASGSSAPPAQNLTIQSWAIDYRIVRGSPLQSDLWDRLENLFRNIGWKRSDGTYLHLACGLFDSRYKPDYVYAFSRRMLGLGLRIYPCEGSITLGRPIVGKPQNRGVPPVPVYEIGTHEAKDVIYQRLDLTDPAAQGFQHYPAIATFSETYFRQLTVEESTMTRGKDGKFYRFFWCPPNERNEPLDCEVYADAAERVLRPNYPALAENLKLAAQPNAAEPAPAERPVQEQRRGLVRKWKR